MEKQDEKTQEKAAVKAPRLKDEHPLAKIRTVSFDDNKEADVTRPKDEHPLAKMRAVSVDKEADVTRPKDEHPLAKMRAVSVDKEADDIQDEHPLANIRAALFDNNKHKQANDIQDEHPLAKIRAASFDNNKHEEADDTPVDKHRNVRMLVFGVKDTRCKKRHVRIETAALDAISKRLVGRFRSYVDATHKMDPSTKIIREKHIDLVKSIYDTLKQ
jgi:hypothetical protein